MNPEKVRGGKKAKVRYVIAAAVAVFAVGVVLATATPDSQSNKIGMISNNTVSAMYHSKNPAIVAQQAYGANSKLL